MMKYRKDIDGLRAVAVLPIVLFHVGYKWIPGGFVGVDIFFVISGYLISSIILSEISTGRFSFRRFYGRRVRRIVPALIFTLLATLVAGYFFLLPNEYEDLTRSAIAALAFVPNIHFWLTSSTYFGLDVVVTPLLHTWSLGVEEQFYILFPFSLYLLLTRTTRKTAFFVLLTILCASLTLNMVAVSIDPKYAFYMLPTRAWEFLAGVVLSLGILPSVTRRYLANLYATIGTGLLVFSFLKINAHSLFPGRNAIPPVLGTALVIYSGESAATVVSGFLSLRIMVGIGVISYSLYLWHWPVTVYTNLYSDARYNRVFIILVSLTLAWISHRYVETRYRSRRSMAITAKPLRELRIPFALVSLVALCIFLTKGFPDRIPKTDWKFVKNDANISQIGDCKPFSGSPASGAQICRLGRPDTQPSFVLWGDSHARAISTALNIAASKLGTSGLLLWDHGCQPLVGVFRKDKHRCQIFNNAASVYIHDHPSLKQVFLAGYWRVPFNGHGYDNDHFLIMDKNTSYRSSNENRHVFRRGIQRTIDGLKGRKITIIQDIPEIGSQFGKSVSSQFVRAAWLHPGIHRNLVYNEGEDPFEDTFYQTLVKPLLAANRGIRYLKVISALCSENKCPLILNGGLSYHDGDHLSQYGASLLAPLFQQSPGLYKAKIPSQSWNRLAARASSR